MANFLSKNADGGTMGEPWGNHQGDEGEPWGNHGEPWGTFGVRW